MNIATEADIALKKKRKKIANYYYLIITRKLLYDYYYYFNLTHAQCFLDLFSNQIASKCIPLLFFVLCFTILCFFLFSLLLKLV